MVAWVDCLTGVGLAVGPADWLVVCRVCSRTAPSEGNPVHAASGVALASDLTSARIVVA